MALACVLAGATAPAAWAQAEPSFALPDGSDALLLRMTEQIPIEGAPTGTQVSVHASGLVVVEYPDFMKRAGRYELRLSRAELEAKVREVLRAGVVEFDGVRVERRRGELERQRVDAARRAVRPGARAGSTGGEDVLREGHDGTVTRLEVSIDGYRAAGGATGSRGAARRVDRELRWRGLRGDAKRNPELAELQGLARACRTLESLTRDPRLVKVR